MPRFRDTFSVFSVRHQKMAKLTEEHPELTPAIQKILEGTLRICEDEGIEPKGLGFKVKIISGRRIMIELETPKERATRVNKAMADAQRREIERKKEATKDLQRLVVLRSGSKNVY